MYKTKEARTISAWATLLCFLVGLFYSTASQPVFVASTDSTHHQQKSFFVEKSSFFCANLHEENLTGNLENGQPLCSKSAVKEFVAGNKSRAAVLLQLGGQYTACLQKWQVRPIATQLIYPFHYHL